MFPLIC